MKIPRLTLTRKSAAASATSATGALDDLASTGGLADKAAVKAGIGAAKRRDEPIVGGTPRVSLLPPELATAAKARATGRGLVLLVVGVVLITGSGVAVATVDAGTAQAQLADAQTDTRKLLKEQAKYSAASDVQELLATVQDARTYTASTEVNWSTYLTSIAATMAPGLVMLDSTATATAPWAAAMPLASPLRSERVATVVMRVQSLSESEISDWVRTLEVLPGFADASIDGWSHDESGFIASVTLNMAADARSGRFSAGSETTAAADADTEADADAAVATDPATTDPATTDPATTDPATTDAATTENGN